MDRYIVYYKARLYRDFDSPPTRMNAHDFFLTYKPVEVIDTDKGMENIWYMMQGDNWSPNGELREYIRALGVDHTSMSIGDVVYNQSVDRFYIAISCGFDELELLQ